MLTADAAGCGSTHRHTHNARHSLHYRVPTTHCASVITSKGAPCALPTVRSSLFLWCLLLISGSIPRFGPPDLQPTSGRRPPLLEGVRVDAMASRSSLRLCECWACRWHRCCWNHCAVRLLCWHEIGANAFRSQCGLRLWLSAQHVPRHHGGFEVYLPGRADSRALPMYSALPM